MSNGPVIQVQLGYVTGFDTPAERCHILVWEYDSAKLDEMIDKLWAMFGKPDRRMSTDNMDQYEDIEMDEDDL